MKYLMGKVPVSDELYEKAIKLISDAEIMRKAGMMNFCVDGECIGCGECCSNLLPMTDKEVKAIRRIVRRKHLKPINHVPIVVMNQVDGYCPFLDRNRGDKKCTIYEHRPLICRDFKCCKIGDGFKINEDFVKSHYSIVNVRDVFWEKDGTIK